MALGLFGKLPAKRDFIARDVPQDVLLVLEPWLQRSMSQSRETMGDGWLERYLSAPLWRFWLHPAVCTRGVMGAMMPSVDGVGRYFPLILCAVAGPMMGYDEPAPDTAPWFDALEETLLSALDAEAKLEALVDRVAALPDPQQAAASQMTAPGMQRPDGPAPAALFWTLGGGDCPPQSTRWSRLPPPAQFAGLLAGERPAPQAGTHAL